MGIHVAESHFTVVAENPNPNGRCLFAPLGSHDGCEGPYIQFNALAAALGTDESGPVRFGAVACVRCLREAIQDADKLVQQGQVASGKTEAGLSMIDKMAAQPTPNFDFKDLPREERERLLREVGPGETVRYGRDVVLIPGSKKQKVQVEQGDAPHPFSIVGISGEALTAPQEIPGKKKGTYDVAHDEEDILADFVEG